MPPPTAAARVTKLLAVRRLARDAAWARDAAAACDTALRAGLFAEADELATAAGLPRERDLARVGLGRALPRDAHPAALRAARVLAGRDAALIAGMKASDSRRRAMELAWEISEGRLDLAAARDPRRLPTEAHEKAAWRGILALGRGDLPGAAEMLMDAPAGPARRWAREHFRLDPPSTPVGKYAAALAAGDRCHAARLLPEGLASDPAAARIAVVMSLCEEHREAAAKAAAGIADPFDRALWRVRGALVDPAPGWADVARAATGARGAAAPLAWLRAAAAFRERGATAEADAALTAAGPDAALFPAELAAARRADPLAAVARHLRTPLVGGAWIVKAQTLLRALELPQIFEVVGGMSLEDAPGGVESAASAATVALAVLDDAARERPGWLRAGLAALDAPLEPPLCIAVLRRAFTHAPNEAPALLARLAARVAPAGRALVVASLGCAPALPVAPAFELLAGQAGLASPPLLAACVGRLDQRALEALAVRIAQTAGPLRDELRVALLEGCAAARLAPPRQLAWDLTSGRSGWAGYGEWLVSGKRPRSAAPADPRVLGAIQRGSRIFMPARREIDDLVAAANVLDRSAELLARIPVTASAPRDPIGGGRSIGGNPFGGGPFGGPFGGGPFGGPFGGDPFDPLDPFDPFDPFGGDPFGTAGPAGTPPRRDAEADAKARAKRKAQKQARKAARKR